MSRQTSAQRQLQCERIVVSFTMTSKLVVMSPAESILCFGRVTDQEVDLGRTEVTDVDLFSRLTPFMSRINARRVATRCNSAEDCIGFD